MHLFSQSHDLFSVSMIIKQDKIVTISYLGGALIIVQIMIDGHDLQVYVMTSFRK